jgi:L-malate glycosyltransferase
VKITFLLPGYVRRPSGGARVVYEYASRLAARGHQVTVVHPRRMNSPLAGEDLSIHGKTRAAIESFRNLLHTPSISWQPIHEKVRLAFVPRPEARYVPDGDVIFATAWHTVQSVLDYPETKGAKFYLIQHYETWMGPQDLVDATWRAPLRKVVISQWLLELGEKMGCSDMTRIPNGIDHDRYRISRPIRGRQPQVAMMVSTTPFKGSYDGMEALKIAHEKHPELKAALFGVSRWDRPIPSWCVYYRNPPQELLVDTIYNQSTVFVSSSWVEGFSLPPAEAAACGCCVVSTDSLGVRDFITHGVSGLLSRPKDPDSLAANLCAVLEDEELRVRLALNAQRSVMNLNWDRSTDSLETLLAECCAPLSEQNPRYRERYISVP